METLKEFVEGNPDLVTRKESNWFPGLFVLKYTREVFTENLWSLSPHLLECRGLVVDSDYRVVVKPFTKIYNYLENSAGSTWNLDDVVMATRKVNGFMAGITLYKGRVIISTTGSLDSDYVGYAHQYLKVIQPSYLKEGYTYLFEIVHPLDPHIIEEVEGAHFLAIVEHATNDHLYNFDHDTYISEVSKVFERLGIHVEKIDKPFRKFSEVLKEVKACKHEGFVVYHLDSCETIKIKSPYYLFNKFMARVGTKRLIAGIRTGTIKEKVEEEFYSVIDEVSRYGVEEFSSLSEQERLAKIKEWLSHEKR